MTDGFPSLAADAERWIAELHDDVTAFFRRADGGGAFTEERWTRPSGGGGVTRVMHDGVTFEKVGVNRSAVAGELERGTGAPMGLSADLPAGTRFFATGVSVVAHPRSPMVPTVHLNVRYFEVMAADGTPTDAWFGGGTDLTPYYPFAEDAAHFHTELHRVCSAHHPEFYGTFKPWCDRYFVNSHRHGEARGVGGIFFDQLRPASAGGLTHRDLMAFADAVGRVLPAAYGTIIDRRRALPYGERERRFQLYRRGRYVEFNLLHDRGTLFGLKTGARVESVLMSLPPLACWDEAPALTPGSFEARLTEMLQPRDWLQNAEPAVNDVAMLATAR